MFLEFPCHGNIFLPILRGQADFQGRSIRRNGNLRADGASNERRGFGDGGKRSGFGEDEQRSTVPISPRDEGIHLQKQAGYPARWDNLFLPQVHTDRSAALPSGLRDRRAAFLEVSQPGAH
jgi:hypothetical protein